MTKRYQQQIDTAFQIACQRVDQAQAMSWPHSAATLARAAEHGIHGLLIAWGAPRRPEPTKIRTAFDDLLRPHTDARLTAAADLLWSAEQTSSPPDGAEVLASITTWLIGQLRGLADAPPPHGWTPPPPPAPVTWEELDEDTRVLLLTARDAATAHVPEVRLFLVGSRAAGRARQDSDYDILMAFPKLGGPEAGQAVGSVSTCSPGHSIDVVDLNQGTWEQPDPSFELQVDLLRQCHIEVPDEL